MKIPMGETPASGSPNFRLLSCRWTRGGGYIAPTLELCQQSSAPDPRHRRHRPPQDRDEAESGDDHCVLHSAQMPRWTACSAAKHICLLLQTDLCWVLIKMWGGRHSPGRSGNSSSGPTRLHLPHCPVYRTGHWEVPRALQERRDETQPLLPKSRAPGGQEAP